MNTRSRKKEAPKIITEEIDVDSWQFDVETLSCGVENPEPTWAYRFLDENKSVPFNKQEPSVSLLYVLAKVPKNTREQTFHTYLEVFGLKELKKQIECNAEGNVVFRWETPDDKDAFIMKWS